MLEPALDELGIEHEWETTGAAAARVCGERRFEVALVDVGIRSPQAVLQALDLRGRRLRRAVILFSDGVTPTPPGIGRLGMEVVPVDQAASALLAALRGDRGKLVCIRRVMAVRSESELVQEIERLRAELARREQESADKERQLERYAADLRETFKQERARAQELRESYMATVRALSNAVEARDAYTGKHAERVAAYGMEIAARTAGSTLDRPPGDRVRLPAARHRQGRDLGPDPVQADRADRSRSAQQMAEHPIIGLGDHPRDRLPRRGRGRRPLAPRALGRHRLPGRARRRADPARGARVRASPTCSTR